MKTLVFNGSKSRSGHRTIRAGSFQARSHLPLAAATLVANAMREQLAALLRCEVAVRLCEPCVPEPQAWPILLASSRSVLVRGPITDVALVLREEDAHGFITAAFGADILAQGPPSLIEGRVIDRLLEALAGTLGPIVGPRFVTHALKEPGQRVFAAYFEVLIEAPMQARVGVAIVHDPPPPVRGCVEPAAMDPIEIEVSAVFACGEHPAAQVVELTIGDVITIEDSTIYLRAQGALLGHGECGVSAGKFAVVCSAGPRASEREQADNGH